METQKTGFLMMRLILQLDRFTGELSLDGLKNYAKKMKSLDDFVSTFKFIPV